MASRIYQSQMNFSAFEAEDEHVERSESQSQSNAKESNSSAFDEETPRFLQRALIILFSLLVISLAAAIAIRYVQTRPKEDPFLADVYAPSKTVSPKNDESLSHVSSEPPEVPR